MDTTNMPIQQYFKKFGFKKAVANKGKWGWQELYIAQGMHRWMELQARSHAQDKKEGKKRFMLCAKERAEEK